MKNIMRAISLGLVCTIAVSNVVQAEESKSGFFGAICGTGLLVASGMLLRKPAALVCAEASRKAFQQVKKRTSWFATYELTQAEKLAHEFKTYLPNKHALEQWASQLKLHNRVQNTLGDGYYNQRARYEAAFEEGVKEADQIITKQTRNWRFRQALAALGFASAFAILDRSFDRDKNLRHDVVVREKERLQDNNKYLQFRLEDIARVNETLHNDKRYMQYHLKCVEAERDESMRLLNECRKEQNACDKCRRA